MKKDYTHVYITIIAAAVCLAIGFFTARGIYGTDDDANDNKHSADNISTFTMKSAADSISYAVGVAQCPDVQDICTYLEDAGASATNVNDFYEGLKAGIVSPDDAKSIAYQLGYQTGIQTKFALKISASNILPAGTAFNMTGVAKGIDDCRRDTIDFKVNGQQLTVAEITDYLDDIIASNQQQAVSGKQKASEDFMKQKAEAEGVHALENGVLYKVITVGKGKTPDRYSTVKVVYEGRLADGAVFDSSKGKTVSFPCSGLIPGFTTALVHMPVGSEWEIYIPWDQAYGENGQGPIPPYSALVFKVKLVGIE